MDHTPVRSSQAGTRTDDQGNGGYWVPSVAFCFKLRTAAFCAATPQCKVQAHSHNCVSGPSPPSPAPCLPPSKTTAPTHLTTPSHATTHTAVPVDVLTTGVVASEGRGRMISTLLAVLRSLNCGSVQVCNTDAHLQQDDTARTQHSSTCLWLLCCSHRAAQRGAAVSYRACNL